MSKSQEEFYAAWSMKSAEQIVYHNEAAIRKIDAIMQGMPVIKDLHIETMLDFGCGYGQALRTCSDRLRLIKSYGFDFSEAAVAYADRNFGQDELVYRRLTSLDIDENVDVMKSVINGKVDCILLIDLLEHIPDCKKLMLKLSELTMYFIVKLPIEENLLDNYVFTKDYPSTKQGNGHLREFNANTVYYFIRNIGLTPIAEGIHVYDFRDSYPPTKEPLTLRQSIVRNTTKLCRMAVSLMLPRKIYIRLFGPGSYYCIATFNKDHILNP
jgi:SAM-dependent methyltransferase